MRMCDTCGRLVKGPRPGGGGAKDRCVAKAEKRALPGACQGRLKYAERVDGKWQIRRHDLSVKDAYKSDSAGKRVGRTTIYPSPRALESVGYGSVALNQAIECWGVQIAHTAHDNAELLTRQEWKYLADVNNGTRWMPRDTSPASGLEAQVLDGDKLDGLGAKWDVDAEALAAKLRPLDYTHAWAVILACEKFWRNHETIDMEKDEWWRL